MTAFARLWSVGAVQNTLVETQPPINLAIWLLVRLVAGGLDSVEHAHGVRSTRSHNRDALANARRTGSNRASQVPCTFISQETIRSPFHTPLLGVHSRR